MSDQFQTTTYNVIDCFELDTIIEANFDVSSNPEWRSFQNGERGQDTFEIFDGDDVEEALDPSNEVESYDPGWFYLAKLWNEGLIPTDLPIFVKVWW